MLYATRCSLRFADADYRQKIIIIISSEYATLMQCQHAAAFFTRYATPIIAPARYYVRPDEALTLPPYLRVDTPLMR